MMEGQTVQALIDALKQCDPEKLILIRTELGMWEPADVEETPENVYIDVQE